MGVAFKVKSNPDRTADCRKCGQTFPNRNTARYHYDNIHSKLCSLICIQCGKTFVNSSALKLHVKHQHQVTNFKCQLCDKKYKYKLSLRKHFDEIHMGLIYECSYCHKQIKNKDCFETHLVKHQLESERNIRKKEDGINDQNE